MINTGSTDAAEKRQPDRHSSVGNLAFLSAFKIFSVFWTCCRYTTTIPVVDVLYLPSLTSAVLSPSEVLLQF